MKVLEGEREAKISKVNEIYGARFKAEPPARACFQVAKLPLDCLVEIEMVALAD
jgi:2-iminobutanoate/2-iminopropanoate deaminase